MYIQRASVDTIHEDLFTPVRVYLTFYTALSSMFWSSSHISALSSTSFLVMTAWYPIKWMYYNLFNNVPYWIIFSVILRL